MNSRFLFIALASSAAFMLETTSLQLLSFFYDSTSTSSSFAPTSDNGRGWMPDLSFLSLAGGAGGPRPADFTTDGGDTTTATNEDDNNMIPPSPKAAPFEFLVPSGEVAVFFNTYLDETTAENKGRMRRRGLQIIELMLGHMRDSQHLKDKMHLYYSHISAEQMAPNETQALMCENLPDNRCTELFRTKQGNEKDTLKTLLEYCQRVPPQELVIYLHNKGALHSNSDNEWLRNLHVRSLVNTDGCYQGFMNEEAPDMCNVCSARFSPMPHWHTSGNMWMAKCGYIKNLLEPQIFEERMTELIDTKVRSSREKLEYWAPQCFDPHVVTQLASIEEQCPAPWNVGKDRYAAEHWVHSHPTVQPCDVLPMEQNETMSYRWAYSLLPRNLKWKPELVQAPRFRLEHYVSPDLDPVNRAQPLTKWTKLEGRLYEWKFLYNATPPEGSWIWKYYEENDALE